MYGMAIAGFLIQDKSGRIRFFEETFLLADNQYESTSRNAFFYSSAMWTFFLMLEVLLEDCIPLLRPYPQLGK